MQRGLEVMLGQQKGGATADESCDSTATVQQQRWIRSGKRRTTLNLRTFDLLLPGSGIVLTKSLFEFEFLTQEGRLVCAVWWLNRSTFVDIAV